MIKTFSLLLLAVLSAHMVCAQVSGTPIKVSTPTASSITKYNQVPVSLANGTIDLSVPLYTLEDSGFTIPITLSNNGSGVKPNQRASWVGTNWSLHAGGVITRVVNEQPDEAYTSIGVPSSDPGKYSYRENYSKLNVSNWSTAHMDNTSSNGFHTDLNPDEFYFNMNGYSGSFFLNHLGKWVVKSGSKAHFKIEASLAGGGGWSPYKLKEKYYKNNQIVEHSIGRIYFGFKITTPNGYVYHFGKTPESIEFTNSFGKKLALNENYVANAWYLTEIEKPNGVSVKFEYERKLNANFSVQRHFTSSYATNATSLPGTSSTATNFSESLSLTKLYTTHLKKIESPNYNIEFNTVNSNAMDYDWSGLTTLSSKMEAWLIGMGAPHREHLAFIEKSKWLKLDKIIVKHKETPIKRIEFKYNDVVSSNDFIFQAPQPKRLFLNEVQVFGGGVNNTSYLPYTFDYKVGGETIPYTTRKLDHWGYYNGVDFFSNPLPPGTLEQQSNAYTQSRNSNFSEMQKGALSAITYPTGLRVGFIYEPHSYSKFVKKRDIAAPYFDLENVGANKIAGGLRIKQIFYRSTTTNKLISKTYEYNKGSLSSGILGGMPNYFETSNTPSGSYQIWSSYPVERMSETNGSHISYSEVKEIETGQGNNGYTIYNFTNHDNPSYRDRPAVKQNANEFPGAWIYDPFDRQNLLRGHLLEKRKFNAQNKLVYEESNFYVVDYDAPVRAVSSTWRNLAGGYEINRRVTAYESSRPFIYSALHSVYSNYQNGTNALVSSTNYEYNNEYRLLKNMSSTNSKGKSLKTIIKYPIDFNNDTATTGVFSLMTNKHIIDVPVHVTKLVDNKVIEANFNQYKHTANNFVIGEVKALEINRPISDYIAPSVNSNNQLILDPRLKSQTFNEYDNKGNLIQQKKEGKVDTFLWGYNYTKPVAIINNANYETVSNLLTNLGTSYFALQSKSSTQLETLFTSLRSSLPTNSAIKDYTYHGATKLLKRFRNERGRRSSYYYDSFNRLKSVCDVDSDNILSYYYYINRNQKTN